MRRIAYTIVFCFMAIFYSFSQGQMRDVVYLKNGSIIRGIIIEQVPNKSIKIQTRDENIFVYQMDEIEKIGKERTTSNNSFKKVLNSDKSYGLIGYRGFVEFGYTTGDDGCIQLTTTHGYQLNPYLFVGGATGVNYFKESESVLIPIWADIRGYLSDGPLTPFIGLRVGYSIDVMDHEGGSGSYWSPSIGVRYMIGERTGLNLSVGYASQHRKFSYSRFSSKINEDGFHIKFGVEF